VMEDVSTGGGAAGFEASAEAWCGGASGAGCSCARKIAIIDNPAITAVILIVGNPSNSW